MAVLADLQADEPIDFGLGLVAYADHRGVWHLERDGTGQVIVSADELEWAFEEELPWLADAVADRLQDAFVESSDGFGQPRPRCPGHPHPAGCEEGWWRCPRTGDRLGRVGELSR